LLAFDLMEGERITDVQIGFHGSRVTVEGAAGQFDITENEILRQTPSWGRRVYRREQTEIFRPSATDGAAYVLAGPMAFYRDGKTRKLGTLSGSAIRGDRSDSLIYSRIAVGDTEHQQCDYRVLYGLALD